MGIDTITPSPIAMAAVIDVPMITSVADFRMKGYWRFVLEYYNALLSPAIL